MDKTKECSTCKGTKQVPTKQSIGFGAANHIMEECPDCLEGEFLKKTRELLRKCDRSRYLQVQHLGASIWSNVIWKRLDRACTYILRLEKQNRDIKQQQDRRCVEGEGMSKYYVAYEDKGPTGPCGQSVECTRPHNDLYIFDDEESARVFIGKARPNASRIMPKIIGFWSEDMGNVCKKMVANLEN